MRKYFITLTAAFVLWLPICSDASAAQNNNPANNVYTVQAGDTLSVIARAKHVSVESIVTANKLADPNRLSIGQSLIIPGTFGTAEEKIQSSPTPITEKNLVKQYKVKPGDTLSGIARSIGVPMNRIIAANKLTCPDKLSVGQVLVILPGGGNNVASRSDIRRHQVESNDPVPEIIEYARTLIGSPYSYSAAGPNSFDCSGFTMTVFSQVGIDLPHSSSLQANKGQVVEKGDLIPGDLVFFRTSGKSISHVGIYIGDGDFIHASSSERKVVIEPLNSNYFASRYVTARRVR